MDLSSYGDDPLAQPTRARLYGLLAELESGATTEQLANRLRLHPNGVRVHLSTLENAGLIRRVRTRHGPGRPRDVWRLPANAHASTAPPVAYRDLSTWLAAAISSSADRLSEVERAGREIGRGLARPGTGVAEDGDFDSALATLGFRPHPREREAGGVKYCLGNCPYREAAFINQEVVCMLHRGITQGLLDELAPGVNLAGFTPKNPAKAGCLIEVDGRPPHARAEHAPGQVV